MSDTDLQRAAALAALDRHTDTFLNQTLVPRCPTGPSFALVGEPGNGLGIKAWTGHYWPIPEASWSDAGIWIRWAATGLGAPLRARVVISEMHEDRLRYKDHTIIDPGDVVRLTFRVVEVDARGVRLESEPPGLSARLEPGALHLLSLRARKETR